MQSAPQSPVREGYSGKSTDCYTVWVVITFFVLAPHLSHHEGDTNGGNQKKVFFQKFRQGILTALCQCRDGVCLIEQME